MTRALVVSCLVLVACQGNQPQPMPGAPFGQTAMPGMTGFPGMTAGPMTAGPATVGLPQVSIVPGGTTPGQVQIVPGGVTQGSTAAPAPPTPTIPPPPPGADPRSVERMNAYTLQMIATGYSPHGAPGADTLGRNASRNFEITMSGGDCYTIAGFGGAGVRDLDGYLYSPSGRQVGKDFAVDSRPIVRSCATETGTYRVKFHMYAGAGPYTYQVYRAAGAAAQAPGLAGMDPRVRERLDRFTAKQLAKGRRADAGLVGSGFLSTGGTQQIAAQLTTGACYTLAGFGGTGVRDLDIYLYGPGGNELGRDVGTDPQPTVEHCPSFPGMYNIKVLVYQGNGPWGFQGYRTGGP